MDYERPYYEDINYHPLLFYVIFGVKDGQLNVSKEKHHIDEFPEGLDFSLLKRPENEAYMRSLIGGALGKILDGENPALYKAIQDAEQWAVIRGEVQRDKDLHYMRNVTGFVQALVENGAIGVLDLQTFSLITGKEWTEKFFSREWNPYDHVTIFTSEMEDGSVWLHTRGMRKFGRPDISIQEVKKSEIDCAAQIVNQMLYYGAVGVFFARPVKLHTHSGLTCIVKPQFVNEPDNPDFNNSYYHVSWDDCEIEN